MPGNCLTNCFTSRFRSRRPSTLFDETLSNTTSNLRAADELDAAQPLSPALETPSTGPVVQHAEEGTESPHFEPAPQPPTPPSPPVPPAHLRPPVPEIVPAGYLVPTLDGAGEYNGDGPTPLSAITERSEPLPSAGTAASIRGGYLPSTDELNPPSKSDVEEDKFTSPLAPPTPSLPPAPPVPPAHPRPSAPEIVPAAKLVPTLDGAGEYNGTGQTLLPAITEAAEPKLSEETEASGCLPSSDELNPPPPYSSSQPSFPSPTLAKSIYHCSKCCQPFETGGLLRRHSQDCAGPEIVGRPFKCSKCSHTFGRGDLLRLHSQQCVGPEIAGRPYNCDKCCYTLDKGDLSEVHPQKCVGHISAGPFKPAPNIARMMAKMGHKEGEGPGKDGMGRTTPIETIMLPRGVGPGHVQDLSSTEITCPPPAYLRTECGIELDDLAFVIPSAAPPIPEVAPPINSIPNLDDSAVSTTENGGSMNAKDTILKFPCPQCSKTYLHAKHLRRRLRRHRGDLPCMCLLCGQKFLAHDIYRRQLQRCAKSKLEHEEERGQGVTTSSARSVVEPRTPPLMSPVDIALPPSSSSEAAFSPDALAPGIVMTPPSDSGSGVQLSENTAVFSHEPPNASNGIILTGWPMSRPGQRRQLYFAYGSNLSTSQMAHRCPSSYLHSSPLVVLRGWEWFIAARGYASIRRIDGPEDKEAQERILEKSKVFGLLYSSDIYSELRLDQAEVVGEGV